MQAADAGARATATRVRRAKRHTEDLSKEIERLDALMGQLREEIVAVGGKLAAHRASPEMRTAERLAEADRVATIAEGEATRLAEAAGDFEAEARSAADRAKTARAIAAEHAANLTTEYRNAATKATIAALGVVHEALLTLIETDPTRARTGAERAIEGRQKLLTGLTEKLADLDTLHGQVATATELRDGAKRRLGDAIGARNRAIDALADARAKLGEALAAWVADLIELPVDETDIEPTLSDLDAGQELNALLLARAADPGNQLAQSRGGAIAARDATKFEIERLAAERERVAALEIQRPEPVAVRPADRAGRAGAPFYECVDFAADLAEDRRAGIEAALEGAGVLDAWVTPEGRILDREFSMRPSLRARRRAVGRFATCSCLRGMPSRRRLSSGSCARSVSASAERE